ncbi:unnamed protein product [Rhodiola kirilowii]
MQVRRHLQDLRRGPNESMYDYLEKFTRFEQSCCNLGLPEKLVVEYLLDGLRPLDQKLLDASAGGTIMSLPLSRIRQLITNVAENARFKEETSRHEEFSQTQSVAKADTPTRSMAEELKQLKEMMQQVIRRQPVQVKPCRFCDATDHKIDACPTIVKDDKGEVNAVGKYQNYNNRVGPFRQYESASTGQGGQNWRNDNRDNHAPKEPTQHATSQPAQQHYYHQQQGGNNGSSQYQQRPNHNLAGLSQ